MNLGLVQRGVGVRVLGLAIVLFCSGQIDAVSYVLAVNYVAGSINRKLTIVTMFSPRVVYSFVYFYLRRSILNIVERTGYI